MTEPTIPIQPVGGNVAEFKGKPDPVMAVADSVVRNADSLARARKALFDAYVKQGFSIEQALTLCVK